MPTCSPVVFSGLQNGDSCATAKKTLPGPEQRRSLCCSTAAIFTWLGHWDALGNHVYDMMSKEALHQDATIGTTAQRASLSPDGVKTAVAE